VVCGSTTSAWYSKVSKSCSISLLLALGLSLMAGMGPGMGTFAAFALLAGHEAFHVFRFGGLDLVAGGGEEEDARVAEEMGRSPLLVTMRRTGMTPWLR
jgi:hypothetical protein